MMEIKANFNEFIKKLSKHKKMMEIKAFFNLKMYNN